MLQFGDRFAILINIHHLAYLLASYVDGAGRN